MQKPYFKKVISIFILLSSIFCIFCFYVSHAKTESLSAKSCILMDASSGRVLYGNNYNIKLPMASTTKIMTAILAIDSNKLNEEVQITKDMIHVEGSSIWLTEGEVFKLEELVYGLMLNSGNDAATAIAYHIAGGIDKFAEMMTKKAIEIGAVNTNFKNPHGLKNPDHYTTAYDLALITRYAYKLPKFKQIVSSKTHKIPYKNNGGMRHLKNHNKLLWNYKNCIGVKTGFTKEAGRCLVSAAERNDLVLISVTLNDPNDWADHTALLNYGFENYKLHKYASKGEMTVQKVGNADIKMTFDQNLELAVKDDELDKIKMVFVANLGIASKKVEKMVIGRMEIQLDGNTLASSNLTVVEKNSSGKSEENFITRLLNKIINYFNHHHH